jgi:hypothetical protein
MNILDVSNPEKVLKKAVKYLGPNVEICLSNRKDKKYAVYNPHTEKWIHFGNSNFSDFTKHQDDERRKNYLARSAKIRGNWKDNKYSPNNLSRNILW